MLTLVECLELAFTLRNTAARWERLQCNVAIIVIIINIIIIFRAISTCMVSEAAMVVLNTKTDPATRVTGETPSLAREELPLIWLFMFAGNCCYVGWRWVRVSSSSLLWRWPTPRRDITVWWEGRPDCLLSSALSTNYLSAGPVWEVSPSQSTSSTEGNR